MTRCAINEILVETEARVVTQLIRQEFSQHDYRFRKLCDAVYFAIYTHRTDVISGSAEEYLGGIKL